MKDINYRFKESPPEETVATIQRILTGLGLEIEEFWSDSGIENCYSLRIGAKGVFPISSNGKGISKELARASAYGELIERIQCGLLFYKYQSITRDPCFDLQTFAPDAKTMTKQELVDSGEWMDWLINSYGSGLTREKLAKQCQIYACTEADSIRCVPYYSLFEDKYVFLPTGFLEHMYSANGCCAGNTKEEAWIHALSEILERRYTISMLNSGKAAPQIPDSVIQKYPTASAIVHDIRSRDGMDIHLYDFSQGSGFPVIASVITDKQRHSYAATVCADPVLEIAIDRTLTESLQGRSVNRFSFAHSGQTLEEVSGMPKAHNILNQLETGSGLFTLDFFTEDSEFPCFCEDFCDLSQKSNKELLTHILEIFRKMGHPVYVRNCSFLGFPTYKIIVPGISESRPMRLTESIPEFALGDAVHFTFRDVDAASKPELQFLLSFCKKIQTAYSRVNNFRGLAGLPMNSVNQFLLTNVTLACAAYKLENFSLAAGYVATLAKSPALKSQDREYLQCVDRYLRLQGIHTSKEKALRLLEQFYSKDAVDRLFSYLEAGKTPFEPYLLRCNPQRCDLCQYRSDCSYHACSTFFKALGACYQGFQRGQDRQNVSL